MRFGRRRRPERRQTAKFDPSQLPETVPVAADDARDEGIMLAEYAARMRLKNRILIDVLGGVAVFDEAEFRADARAVLGTLAAEMRRAADLAAEEGAAAAKLRGRAQDMHDYRAADVDNLGLRERVNLAVAAELERQQGDDAYLDEFIRAARDDAWGDLAGAIGARLDLERPQSAVDAGYESTRAERMRMIQTVDLARLAVDRLDY